MAKSDDDDDKKPKDGEQAAADDGKPKDDEKAQADDDKPKDDEKAQADGEGEAVNLKGIVKAIKSGKIAVADFKEILAAIQEQEGGGDAPADAAPAAAPGAEVMSRSPEDVILFGKMHARLDMLEAKDKTRDAGDSRVEEVEAAVQRLHGRSSLGTPAELKERLLKFHKENGGKSLEAYVEEVATSIPPDADPDNPTAADLADVPAEAMQFSKSGTDAIDKASHFGKEWDQLIANGSGMKASKEAYVRLNMQHIGFKPDTVAKSA